MGSEERGGFDTCKTKLLKYVWHDMHFKSQ